MESTKSQLDTLAQHMGELKQAIDLVLKLTSALEHDVLSRMDSANWTPANNAQTVSWSRGDDIYLAFTDAQRLVSISTAATFQLDGREIEIMLTVTRSGLEAAATGYAGAVMYASASFDFAKENCPTESIDAWRTITRQFLESRTSTLRSAQLALEAAFAHLETLSAAADLAAGGVNNN